MKDPAPPSDEEGDSTERGDRPEFRKVSEGEEVETAGEKDDSSNQPVESKRSRAIQGDGKESETVEEVVEGGGLPIIGAAGLGEAVGERVGAEGTEGDAQKQHDSGDTETGGGGHEQKGRISLYHFQIASARSRRWPIFVWAFPSRGALPLDFTWSEARNRNFVTEILVIFSLLLLNGVFAMAEIALISARRSRLTLMADAGKKGARLALKLGENPERFLSTVQVGITLIGVLAGAYGGKSLAPYLSPLITQIPVEWISSRADQIAFGLVVVIITYFSLILGELVPKGLALRFPETIASAMAKPMEVLSTATKPLVSFLELSTKLVLKLFGKRPEGDEGASVADVEVILREGIITGTVKQEESEMVEGIFDLREVLAEEVMQPRPRILFLPHNATPDTYWPQVAATNQTVFPVYEDNRDSVSGLVSLRMLFANLASPRPRPLGEVCVEPLFVSETQSALSLLDTLRHSRLGAALVADEFGTVRGLITLEDLVEEVVGELRPGDFQKDRPGIRVIEENSWLADGLLEIDTVEEEIPGFSVLTEAEKEPFQTLAGYIVHRLDRLPIEGEAFAAGEFEFEIIDMDRQRIDKVAIRRVVPGEEEEEAAEESGEKLEA